MEEQPQLVSTREVSRRTVDVKTPFKVELLEVEATFKDGRKQATWVVAMDGDPVGRFLNKRLALLFMAAFPLSQGLGFLGTALDHMVDQTASAAKKTNPTPADFLATSQVLAMVIQLWTAFRPNFRAAQDVLRLDEDLKKDADRAAPGQPIAVMVSMPFGPPETFTLHPEIYGDKVSAAAGMAIETAMEMVDDFAKGPGKALKPEALASHLEVMREQTRQILSTQLRATGLAQAEIDRIWPIAAARASETARKGLN